MTVHHSNPISVLRRSFERRRSVCPLEFAARRPSEPRSGERSQSRTGRLARWLHGHRPPHTLQPVSSGSGISSKNRCAPHPPTHLLFRLMGRSLRGDRTAQLQPSTGRGVRRATPSSRRLLISPFRRLSESSQAFLSYGAQISSDRSRSAGAWVLIGWPWRRKGVGCTFCHGMSERVEVSHPARASAIRDRAFGKCGSFRTKRHSLFSLCRAVASFVRTLRFSNV